MKISYDPETDSLYIDLLARTSTESEEVSPGFVIDYDSEGCVVGIEIDHASRRLDLHELTLSKIPVEQQPQR